MFRDEKSAQRIKTLRRKLGLSQDEFAERLDSSRSYISQLERGVKTPAGKFLRKVEEMEIERGLLTPESVHADRVREHSAHPRALLANARTAAHFTQRQLADAVGRSVSFIADLESGDAPINEPLARRIAATLGIRAEDLLAGSDLPHVIDETGVTGVVGATPNLGLPEGQTARYVPLLSYAQAGAMHGWIDEGYTHTGVVAMGLPKGARAFAVTIQGDSMEPKIEDGDTAVVLWGLAPRQGEEVVACLENGDVMCKIYHSHERGTKITLTSYNSEVHPPIHLDQSEVRWIYPVDTIIKKRRRS